MYLKIGYFKILHIIYNYYINCILVFCCFAVSAVQTTMQTLLEKTSLKQGKAGRKRDLRSWRCTDLEVDSHVKFMEFSMNATEETIH